MEALAATLAARSVVGLTGAEKRGGRAETSGETGAETRGETGVETVGGGG